MLLSLSRATTDPGGIFRVVSKDGGFDPLIAHLQGRGHDVARWLDLNGGTPDRIEVPDPTQDTSVVATTRPES